MTTAEKLREMGLSISEIARYAEVTTEAVRLWLREQREPTRAFHRRALKRLLAKVQREQELEAELTASLRKNDP